MPAFFDAGRPQNGLTYSEYRAEWQRQKETSKQNLDPDERKTLHYLNYNWDRQARVHEQYTPSDELQDAISRVDESQMWMILTEPWCGDSAFLLPIIAEAATLSDQITLRILLRDDNLDIMDQYLTDGGRSIPKLVAFSDAGDELFDWGPRPKGARQLFASLRETYDEKMKAIEELIAHYEDGGWQEADAELADAVRMSVPTHSG